MNWRRWERPYKRLFYCLWGACLVLLALWRPSEGYRYGWIDAALLFVGLLMVVGSMIDSR